MNQQEAVDFIISELGKLHPRNDIIEKLCETIGINWNEAEKLVQKVEMENRGRIAQKQSPMVVAIGAVTVLAGLALSFIVLYETLQGIIIILLNLPIPYLGNIVYFLIGIAMVIGGLRGTWDTIVRVWNS